MKKNIWVIIAIVIVLVYFSFNRGVEKDPMLYEDYDQGDASSPTEPAPPLFENLNRFHDKGGNYQIDYPADWTLTDRSRSGKMIRADLHKGNSVGFQIRIVKQGNTSFESFASAFIQRFMNEMSNHWKGEMTELSRDFGWIGAHEGCSVRIMMDRGNGQRWFFKEYLWPMVDGSDRVVVFQCGTRAKDQAENEPILDAVAQSLKFI
jgi:hypothetical protein